MLLLSGMLNPKEGETIFISAASGAVGGLVGQIAKQIFKCKVIGSCGGPEKCALVKEKFGFDHAIDYKTVQTSAELVAKLREVAPEGDDCGECAALWWMHVCVVCCVLCLLQLCCVLCGCVSRQYHHPHSIHTGIDMYFDNVAGIHFTAAMDVLRPFGRVAQCGSIR